MKCALTVLGSIILALAVIIAGAANHKPSPPDPAMLELYQRVGAEWMKKPPIGVASVEVSGSSLIISIEYALVFDRSQIATHQRQLLRAVLAEIKAKEMALPGLIWVYSAERVTGETGKRLLVYLGHSTWDDSTDVIKFEQKH